MQTKKKTNTISWWRFLRQTPHIISRIPYLYRGLKIGKTKENEPCGLAITCESIAKSHPNSVAIKYHKEFITYYDMNARANKIAHYLNKIGIKKGDVICVLMENRPELLIIVLALAKLGVISALINTSQRNKVLQHSFNLVTPVACIIGCELVDAFTEIKNEINIPQDKTYVITLHDHSLHSNHQEPCAYENLIKLSQHEPDVNIKTSQYIYKEDPLFYMYTSGTTGLPKAGIFKNGRWMKVYGGFGIASLSLDENDTLYCTLPLYHATGLCVCWASALAGCSAFAIRKRFSASKFWDDVRYYNATAISYVGEMCRYLIEQPLKDTDIDNPVVKMIGNGLRPNIWKIFKYRFNIKYVYEFYAASDGNIGFTNLFNFDNTIGFSPMPWKLIEYDVENDQPIKLENGFYKPVTKKGRPGLLLAKIDDDNPLDGYTDMGKTSKVILENVFIKGDRYFNTGDLITHLGFGHAQFVDRLGDTFRWKGENVSTNEVENIINEFESIAESVVYGVEITNTNGRAGMVTLTLQPELQENLFNINEFQNYLQDNLPTYAQPLFIRIKKSIELTGTFKYKKFDLKQEGFDPTKVAPDTVYAFIPREKCYKKVDATIFNNIMQGKYRY